MQLPQIRITSGFAVALLALALPAQEQLLIGTSDGSIRVMELGAAGNLTPKAKLKGPGPLMFLAFHPRLAVVYAAVGRGVQAFARDGDALRPTAQRDLGLRVTHLEVDRDGRFLFAASYGGNTVLAMPLDATGAPEAPSLILAAPAVPTRKAHQVRAHPRLPYVYAPCLGDDAVQVLAIASVPGTEANPAAATPEFAVRRVGQANLAPGSGPRHLDFHPDGGSLYVLNELSSTIYAYRIDPETGLLDGLQRLRAVPDDHQGGSGSSDIHVSADGRFVYAVHREPRNEIVTLAVGADRRLTVLDRKSTGGRHSRSFCLSGDGRFLVLGHSRSQDVVVHRRDPESGRLTGIVGREGVGAAAVFVGFWPGDGDRAYGIHDLRSLVKRAAGGGGTLDRAGVDRVLRDLESHVRRHPPTFRSAGEKRRARADARALSDMLRSWAAPAEGGQGGKEAEPAFALPLWMRTARAHVVAHRLGVAGAAERATEAFEGILRRHPDHAEANLRFATLLAALPEGAGRALPFAEKARRAGQPGADGVLGRICLQLGDRKRAVHHLERHCEANPTDRRGQELLAAARGGKKDAASRKVPRPRPPQAPRSPQAP